MNQFTEWTDEQVHLPGGPLEGWQEEKVKRSTSQLLPWGPECKDPPILAIDLEEFSRMVSR